MFLFRSLFSSNSGSRDPTARRRRKGRTTQTDREKIEKPTEIIVSEYCRGIPYVSVRLSSISIRSVKTVRTRNVLHPNDVHSRMPRYYLTQIDAIPFKNHISFGFLFFIKSSGVFHHCAISYDVCFIPITGFKHFQIIFLNSMFVNLIYIYVCVCVVLRHKNQFNVLIDFELRAKTNDKNHSTVAWRGVFCV